jgi:DNA-binding NarL/FixJ family response regulator
MPHANRATVLIADAKPVARHGLATLIDAHGRLRVVAQTPDARAARDLCARHKPRLIVLDPAMDAGEGFTLLRELPRWAPRAAVVAFTRLEDGASVQRALRLGALGYVTRRDPIADVLAALMGALLGERQVSRRVERVLLAQLACGAVELRSQLEQRLSAREMQIFRLLGEGHPARAIAEQLRLSVKTIESHQQRIREKLGAKSGTDLRRRATLFVGGEAG